MYYSCWENLRGITGEISQKAEMGQTYIRERHHLKEVGL